MRVLFESEIVESASGKGDDVDPANRSAATCLMTASTMYRNILLLYRTVAHTLMAKTPQASLLADRLLKEDSLLQATEMEQRISFLVMQSLDLASQAGGVDDGPVLSATKKEAILGAAEEWNYIVPRP